MLTALLVIAILVLLIVAHEFGHFITAKLFGVRVDEFGFGFPPRALLLGRFGGTEYTLNWIPFGGFVRLFGEDSAARGSGSFAAAPRWKQAIILVAGVVMNVILAWVLFFCAYAVGVLHTVEHPAGASPLAGERLLVTDVVAGSPAAAAGVRAGDEILSIAAPDGTQALLTPDGVLAFVSERGGEELSLSYLRAGATSSAELTPAHAILAHEAGRPAIGVGLALVTESSAGFQGALRSATVATGNALTLVAGGLWTIIDQSLHGAPDLSSVTGPVGLVGAVGDAARSGVGYLLSLAAFISVNLAVINLIPIPALDGGRLVVVGVEALLRRPAPHLAVQLLNTIGVALIILLMITVTYHDIARLIQ